MADRLTNIELLIMLSEDVRAQGDDLTAEMHQRGQAHARRVVELLTMLERARTSLLQERDRYSHYLPANRQERAEARLAETRSVEKKPDGGKPPDEPKMPSFLAHKAQS
jgi:hypothetical protein